jgi:uncharacterized alpha-E superfamily protein
VLARIAHELFWLGRSMARAEHTARMLDGVFHAELQGRPDDPLGVTLSWNALLAIMGAKRPDDEPPARRDEVLRALTTEADSPASVLTCVSQAREGARMLRDVISTEMWEAVNTFYLDLQETDLPRGLRTGPYSLYQMVKERCALFWGLADRTMLHDDASAFLVAGGRIESADMVLRMLRVALPPSGADNGQALALLHAVGGFQAFRRAVASAPNAAPVAHFLLFNAGYPNSVAAAVAALHEALDRADASPRSSPPVLRLARLSADLEFRGRAVVADPEIASVLEEVQGELVLVDRDVGERYFAGSSTAIQPHLLRA